MKDNNFDNLIKDLEGEYSTSRINSIKVTYKKMCEYFSDNNIDITKLTREDILSFLKDVKSRGYTALQTRISAVRDILDYYNNTMVLNITEIKEESLVYDERYYFREEVEDLANLFVNPQDKAIILLLFNGVCGKGYEELLNLKVSDVDLDNRVIHLKDRDLKMDDALFEAVKDTIDTDIYFKYLNENALGNTNKSYFLNPNCEYLLKPKKFVKNRQGLDPFKLNGIQRRLCKLTEVAGVKLTGKSLMVSGAINKINEEKIKTTVASIDKWLHKNNWNLQAYEVYRIYNIKFGETL